MKALILNSGMGKRMGALTTEQPKCMTEIGKNKTILSRQLRLLSECGINEIVMTTGLFSDILIDYCKSLNLNLDYKFVHNDIYDKTNYIYSIYLAREYLYDDIVLMHGDLVFEKSVIEDVLAHNGSCMTVSSTIALPPKDFKAVLEKDIISKIGVEFFDNAVAAQPLYKLEERDWLIWLDKIIEYCKNGQVSCYAENAFNDVSSKCSLYPIDYKNRICGEIDTPEDLEIVVQNLQSLSN